MPKSEEFKYGDLVCVRGIYEKAKSATNYKAFNYREYLKEKNIYGIVNVEECHVLKSDNLNFVFKFFNDIRKTIKNNLNYILGEKASIVIGMLLRRYIRYRRWNCR